MQCARTGRSRKTAHRSKRREAYTRDARADETKGDDMERTITEHQHDELNKSIEITSHAEGIFGASDCYSLEYGKRGAGGARIVLLFQTGAMGEVGVNGLACEALIVVMLDRLRAFQDGPMRCAENAEVIHHLEQALVHCVRRSERRIAAGVKDTAQPLA